MFKRILSEKKGEKMKENWPTKKELESGVRTYKQDGYPFYGNSGTVLNLAKYALHLLDQNRKLREGLGALADPARWVKEVDGIRDIFMDDGILGRKNILDHRDFIKPREYAERVLTEEKNEKE